MNVHHQKQFQAQRTLTNSVTPSRDIQVPPLPEYTLLTSSEYSITIELGSSSRGTLDINPPEHKNYKDYFT